MRSARATPTPTSSFSPLSSQPLSSSSSTPASYSPSSTGGTSSTKAIFQPTSGSTNYPHTSPVPRFQYQHQHQYHSLTLPSPSPAGHHPFTIKNSTHKVRPDLTRRLSSSGLSTSSFPSPLLFPPTLSSSCSTASPLLNPCPRRLYAAQQHSLGLTATRSSKPGVQTGALVGIKSAADTANFLDERGQPQLLKLSSHNQPLFSSSSSLPSWLSAAGREGGTAGDQLQQLRHRHQQGRTRHGDHDHSARVESSKPAHGWIENSRQCSADLQYTTSDSTTGITVTASTTMTTSMAVGSPSRSNSMVEAEGETGSSQDGGEGQVRVDEDFHGNARTDGYHDDDGGSDDAGRWNAAKMATADIPQQQQQLPISPLTPIPTDALHKSSSTSSFPSLLSSLQQQQNSFSDTSNCMTPPHSRSSQFVASTFCSPDQQPPVTTITTSPTTTMLATTTIPLTGEIIGPTLLMHDTNLEDQQQQQQQVIIHPPTPRSKPKPSPIATKSLPRRMNSLGLSHNGNTSKEAQQPDSFSTESNNSTDCIAQPATCGVDGDFLNVFAAGYRKSGGSGGESNCSSDEEEARDSGVVLEPWDQPLLQHQRDQPQQQHGTRSLGEAIPHKPETIPKPQPSRQPFPNFDQLFQPSLDLLGMSLLARRMLFATTGS